MFQRMLFPAILVAALGALIGCASIIHGTKQKVLFQSTPDGATVDVTDAMDVSYGTCLTPCTLDLKRKNSYKATISKSGYDSVELVVERGTDGWIWGNILLGGVIGLVIDFSNGAAYKLSPTELHATLPAISGEYLPTNSDEPTLILIDFDDLAPEEQAAIAQLGAIPWPASSH